MPQPGEGSRSHGPEQQLSFITAGEYEGESPDLAGGLFVTIEGGEGAGKSTQARMLNERLSRDGRAAILVREPGATPLGDYVRDWIKRDSRTVPLAEVFLFEAARAQLIQTVVKPALAEGRVVICDRFSDSTLAYQGYGRGVSLSDIQSANRIAADGVRPDLTVLLDMDPDTALERVGNKPRLGAESTGGRVDNDQQRRFEQESMGFHERVLKGFRELAAAEPDRWTVVDATQSAEKVAEAVWTTVEARLVRRD